MKFNYNDKKITLKNGSTIDLGSLSEKQYKAIASYFNSTEANKTITLSPKGMDGLPSFKGYKANKLM